MFSEHFYLCSTSFKCIGENHVLSHWIYVLCWTLLFLAEIFVQWERIRQVHWTWSTLNLKGINPICKHKFYRSEIFLWFCSRHHRIHKLNRSSSLIWIGRVLSRLHSFVNYAMWKKIINRREIYSRFGGKISFRSDHWRSSFELAQINQTAGVAWRSSRGGNYCCFDFFIGSLKCHNFRILLNSLIRQNWHKHSRRP